MKLRLDWKPLRSIAEFTDEAECKRARPRARGVYLWGFSHNGAFIPYNVGKANNIHERALQHDAALVGGAYPVYHPDVLDEFHKYKNAQVTASGKLYSPEGLFAFRRFYESTEIKSILTSRVAAFRFTYALVEPKEVKTRWVEQRVADHFGRAFLQSSVTGVAPNHLVVHHGGELVQEFGISARADGVRRWPISV